MFKSLYFKIVLILSILIITVMCAVSVIMLNSVSDYYVNDFISQMNENFSDGTVLMTELEKALASPDPAASQKTVVASYASVLGIDEYRDYFILDENGTVLEGSDSQAAGKLKVTPNILNAIASGKGEALPQTGDSADFAVKTENGGKTGIIYITDSLEEMRQMNKILFKIILQALFWSIVIAVILSFFLAKAITSPIQSITNDAQLVAKGEFEHTIDVHTDDEIGILADNFNYMKDTLKSTIDKFDGERQKLKTTFAFLRDAVIVFSDDDKVMNYNESADQLVPDVNEYTLDALLEDFDLPLDRIGASLITSDGCEPIPPEGRIYSDKPYAGKVYDVSVGEITYMSEGERATGVIAVMHDVTSRFELDSARREFVANVSHELRTPLTSIKGACETIAEDAEMPRDTEEYFLNMALGETDRMIRIVSDLLVLSRLDDNRTKWSIEQFGMNALVRHICDVMKTSADDHGHTVVFEPKGEYMIEADKGRIEQVIINIVSNAVKYTPDGGEITVKTSKKKDRICVSVSDNGIGIPKADIPHLFERFYRVEKARTSDTGGTGLGLAIAKEIVEAHGGEISVSSKQGKGTTVEIGLPEKCVIEA